MLWSTERGEEMTYTEAIKKIEVIEKRYMTLDEEERKALIVAIKALQGQEESIPISWMEEKLTGHPELPYAFTDGINDVLEAWEREKQTYRKG